MSTVRRHTRITSKGRRVTVRQHERDGQAAEPGVIELDTDPYVITHDRDGGAGTEPIAPAGPSPYPPHEIARAEQFAYACEVLGYSPADVMNMPAVRDRIMRAIG
jgi:hypothetical protein